MALVVETGLLVVTTVLPAPPSMLVRLGDREIRNWAARRSSVLETPLGFALPAPAVAGAAAGGIDNWLERAGFDAGEGEATWGFDTAWFARLDAAEPDCPGGVAACW